MFTRRFSLTGCTVTLAMPFLAQSVALADERAPRLYNVTSQTDTAGQTVTTRELLAIGSHGGKPFVRISDGAATASFAANVASDGEISTDSADAGLICYNMATAVVTAHGKDSKSAVPLYVRFLDKIVAIPLTVSEQDGADGASVLSFEGSNAGVLSDGKTSVPAGMLVRGTISKDGDAIESAVFEEATMAGSPAARVSGNTCALTEVPQAVGT